MLDLITTTDGAVRTIALTGELDFGTAPRLHTALTGLRLRAGDRLVLDLAGLSCCDSSGLTVFIAALDLVRGAGAALVLAAPPKPVLRMLRVTGLDEVFDVGRARTGVHVPPGTG